MLVDFSVQNFASFNSKQELNMTASKSTKEQRSINNTKEVNAFGIDRILKSAAIFGANGSGKSNFVQAMSSLQRLILSSLDSVGEKEIKRIHPFLLKEGFFNVPIEFEVSFLAAGNLYRYGIAISNNEIEEEWLYWTKTSRETLLFHRKKQTVSYNQRSFSEAKLFTKKEGDIWLVDKTKPFVPFISVLSQFDGEKSSTVTDWFQKFNIISGLSDTGFKSFTIELFEENSEFKTWALEILKAIQINDIQVEEYEHQFPMNNKSLDDELKGVISSLQGYIEKNKPKEKRITVIKENKSTGNNYSLPLSLESEGTRKLIYLLGPLYEVIKKNEVLVIDEFDNKFHTLLCKFIINLYNQNNHGNSQLIVTCHDTNLLTNKLFRRDQIWFIEKNDRHESELYSLLEYKEHYTRKEDSYSKDYLSGKYGAIPLFSDISEIREILDGKK